MAIEKELPILQSAGPDLTGARPLSPSKAAQIMATRKPEWLKIRPPGGENYLQIKEMLRERKLNTVCQEAHCPNLTECWASGTATFMLGGDTCTRACRFCAVKTARIPPPLDPEEPFQIAASIATLGLHYVVLTSVDRDDLTDGGAGHFARTIQEIKRLSREQVAAMAQNSPANGASSSTSNGAKSAAGPRGASDRGILVEALVSDFRGDPAAIEMVVASGLDVYAHNIETVRSLQYRVRDPRAGYEQSLATLRWAKKTARETGRDLLTKSSIMLGLGETSAELDEAMDDLRASEVDILTFGQYLRPSMTHLPVEKYYTPEEFEDLRLRAQAKGFVYVASGPMVRSSYRAGELFIRGMLEKERTS